MKKSILTLVVLIIFHKGFAQKDFQKGYVLLTKTDTLFGEINNNSYSINSKYCVFIERNTNNPVQYSPGQIFGYRFTKGKFYVSKIVTDGNKMTPVFLEYLIHGLLDIYYYQDSFGNNHYLAGKEGIGLRELEFGDIQKEIDGSAMIHDTKQYTGVLNSLTTDVSEFDQDIQDMGEPDHKSLIKLAKVYHLKSCGKDDCIIYETKEKTKWVVNPFSGITTFFSPYSYGSQKNYLSYGINFYFNPPTLSDKTYIGVGFAYEGVIQNESGQVLDVYRIPVSFNYIHPKKGFSPTYSYEVDLNKFIGTQTLRLGLKYTITKVSFVISTEIKTEKFIEPYGTSQRLGLFIDLN